MKTMSAMQKYKNDFSVLLVADAISSLGSNLTAIALTLFAFETTNNLLAASIFPMMSLMPKFIITPLLNRVNINLSFRKLFFLSELFSGIVISSLIWMDDLKAVCLIYSIYVSIFFISEVYRAEFLKTISTDDIIYKRQSISRVVNIFIAILGPILAGFILTNYAIKLVFVIDVISYLCASFIILGINNDIKPFIRVKDLNSKMINNRKRSTTKVLKQIHFTENSNIYIGSMLITFIGGATSLLTLSYVIDFLGESNFHYGILMSCLSIGSIIGSLLVNVSFIQKRLKIISSFATFLSGMLLLSVWFLPGFTLMAFILTFSGILGSLVMCYYSSELLIRYKPEEIRGKYALFQMTIDSSTTLSKPFAGALERYLNVIASLILMGFIFITATPVNYIKRSSSIESLAKCENLSS